MTAFDILKDSVDIVDAAERYGIEVNRHKKALCPFHNDRHPSLSFKAGRFTCFSCGATGDAIDLVGRLETVSRSTSSNIDFMAFAHPNYSGCFHLKPMGMYRI